MLLVSYCLFSEVHMSVQKRSNEAAVLETQAERRRFLEGLGKYAAVNPPVFAFSCNRSDACECVRTRGDGQSSSSPWAEDTTIIKAESLAWRPSKTRAG